MFLCYLYLWLLLTLCKEAHAVKLKFVLTFFHV
uniref:Uncharacterized protein n=1 Tax=Rhizophora mucronata TaxID=61149 RepID=A0A2P2PR08_RHIMU